MLLISRVVLCACCPQDTTIDCMGNCKKNADCSDNGGYIGNIYGYQNECTSDCGGSDCNGTKGCDECNECWGFEHDGSSWGTKSLFRDADGDGKGHETLAQNACPNTVASPGWVLTNNDPDDSCFDSGSGEQYDDDCGF